MKKLVLIISQYYPPDISGGGTRAHNYASCLSKEKYEIIVITAVPHLHSKYRETYSKKIFTIEQKENFKIVRFWIPKLLHDSVFNRVVLHSIFLLNSILPIIFFKPDIIIASEPNLFSVIPAYFYSKIRGSKIIRVVDDMWPEIFYERKIVKNKIVKRILDKLAKFSYTYPDVILPLTIEAKKHIMNLYQIKEDKIIILEHGINEKYFFYTKEENSEEFTVMYSGALVESYDFNLFFNLAKLCSDNKIKFVIRGKGNLVNEIKQKKEHLKLKNLEIHDDIVSLDKLRDVLSKSNIFFIPIKNDYFLNLSLPTKILEFQALGRTILITSNGAPGNYIKKTNSGLIVDNKNADKILEEIYKLKNNYSERKKFGNSGSEYAKKFLTFEKIGKRLEVIIDNI